MNFANHKNHKKGTGKGMAESSIYLETLFQCAAYLLEIYKMSFTSSVVLSFEHAGIGFRTSRHHHTVPMLENVNQMVG